MQKTRYRLTASPRGPRPSPDSQQASVKVNNVGHVSVFWYWNGGTWEYWSIVTTCSEFVRWVEHGFKVICSTCWARTANGRLSVPTCTHTRFPSGGRVKATALAKAIDMGLVD